MENFKIKIRKKAFKEALAKSKRVIPKKNGISVIIGHGKEALIFSKDEKIEIYDYVDLLEEVADFAFKFDPALVDKWLDKGDRDMEFEVVFEESKKSKKEGKSVFLYSPEKKKRIEVDYVETSGIFKDLRKRNYENLVDKEKYLSLFTEANKSFQKSDKTYADYAKLTDINMFVFDPFLFSVFIFREKTNIMDRFGNDGIAVHRKALDVITKSIKKPKEFTFLLNDSTIDFKEGNTIYSMKFTSDIRFPDYRSIKSLSEEKQYVFKIDAEQVNEVLKSYPNADVKKVIFEKAENGISEMVPDSDEHDSIFVDVDGELPRSVFANEVLKSFFEGLKGEVTVTRVLYESKTTKKGRGSYFWILKSRDKSKIMPGIIEAQGFESKPH